MSFLFSSFIIKSQAVGDRLLLCGEINPSLTYREDLQRSTTSVDLEEKVATSAMLLIMSLSQVEAREELENMGRHQQETDPKESILLSGDIESNPGPPRRWELLKQSPHVLSTS